MTHSHPDVRQLSKTDHLSSPMQQLLCSYELNSGSFLKDRRERVCVSLVVLLNLDGKGVTERMVKTEC